MKLHRLAAVALLLGPGAAFAADLVLLKDGGRRTGELRSCVADQCRLNSQTIPRKDIAWIGFRDPAEPPPMPPDPAADSVHLNDATAHVSPVLGISLGEVTTEAAA